MTVRPFRLALACLAVAFAMFVAACGGDDDDTTTDAGGSGSGDSQSESDAEQAAEDAIGANLGGECSFLGKFAGVGLEESFDPSAAFAEGGEVDFGALYGPLAEEFGEVADAAPSEIKDAFQTMTEALGTLADQLDGVTLDFSDPTNIDPEAMAKFEELGEVFEDSKFEDASNEIEAWIESNCENVG